MRQKFLLAIAAIVLLAGCEPEDLRLIPAGEGAGGIGSGFLRAWRGESATPAPANDPLTTGLAESHTNNDNDLNNIPGVQEVHFVMTYNRCRDMYNQYKSEGLTGYRFIRSRQPGAPGAGFCKLFGPGARDDRFHDHRYDSSY